MASSEDHIDRLRLELADVEAQFWAGYSNMTMNWQFVLGPIRIERRTSAMFIAQVFVLFHVLCFSVGATLIFVAGPARELGIAMVVGSIFAFGSFVGQFWAVAYDRGRKIFEEVIGNQDMEQLKELASKREIICEQISQLETAEAEAGNHEAGPAAAATHDASNS
jgi:hypothetical protein